MRRPAGALALLAWVAIGAQQASAIPTRLAEIQVQSTACGDLVASGQRILLDEPGSGRWVDPAATYWDLAHPVAYRRVDERWKARERYRVGDGAVTIEAELHPEGRAFVWRMIPEPAGDFDAAVAQYLPGISLPCEVRGSLNVQSGPDDPRAPEQTVRLYRLLHEAEELLYERRFEAARERLRQAQAEAPDSATVRWLRARAWFLEGESIPAERKDERLEAFVRAERHADEAVELDPESAEGHLWRAVARGRIGTTQGKLQVALAGLRRGRGPRWIAEEFDEAIRLEPTYRNFGFSARGDALYGAAQLYRLLPDAAWASTLLGIRGDIDRAVELARAALAVQPTRIEYAKELGAGLLCRGSRRQAGADIGEARHVLRGALSMPVRTRIERIDRQHVGRLLSVEPRRACAYSRDGWQDGSGPVQASR